MKIIGGLLIFVALYNLNEAITFTFVGWLLLGIFLIAVEEWAQLFAHTVRYIHRDKR